MIKKISTSAFICLLFLSTGASIAKALTDSSNISLTVNACNENSLCQIELGETNANCPTDCQSSGAGTIFSGGILPTVAPANQPLANLPLINPIYFKATYKSASKSVDLEWQNPASPDLVAVRIVKSKVFFPIAPDDGVLVYEGLAESFRDTNVLSGFSYFYTIFAKDSLGRYSSGVIAGVKVFESVRPTRDVEISDEKIQFEELPVSEEAPFDVSELLLIVSQDGGPSKILSHGSRLTLEPGKNISISTGQSKLPDVLKTVVVSLQHPSDPSKVFSFLLRANNDNTEYRSVVGSLQDPGEYVATVYLVDHKFARLAKINSSILIPYPQKNNHAVAGLESDIIAFLLSILGMASGTLDLARTHSVGTLFGFSRRRRQLLSPDLYQEERILVAESDDVRGAILPPSNRFKNKNIVSVILRALFLIGLLSNLVSVFILASNFNLTVLLVYLMLLTANIVWRGEFKSGLLTLKSEANI